MCGTKTLQNAIAEAERFIKQANLAIEHIEIAKDNRGNDWKEHKTEHSTMYCAAAKRASMDLTRVLVDVRGRRRY
jgi:hypothetical protein